MTIRAPWGLAEHHKRHTKLDGNGREKETASLSGNSCTQLPPAGPLPKGIYFSASKPQIFVAPSFRNRFAQTAHIALRSFGCCSRP